MNSKRIWFCPLLLLIFFWGCKSESPELSEEVNAKNDCFESFEMAVKDGRVNDMKSALSAKSIAAWEQEFRRSGAGIKDWDAFLESRRSSLAALMVDDVVIKGDKATVINTLGSRYACVKEEGKWKREIPVDRVESIPPDKKARKDCFEPFFASIAEGDVWGVKGNLTSETRSLWEKAFQAEGAEFTSWEEWVKAYASRLPSRDGATIVASEKEAMFTLSTGWVYTCVLQNDTWRMVIPLDAFPPEPPPEPPPAPTPTPGLPTGEPSTETAEKKDQALPADSVESGEKESPGPEKGAPDSPDASKEK